MMKKLFWISLGCLLLFEFANVYFIMPIPGSQQLDTLSLAYFLFTKRWWFRSILFAALLFGWIGSTFAKKWIPLLAMLPLAVIIYFINFKMAADRMFRPVQTFRMVAASENKIDSNRLVVGVSMGNEARAYPLRLIGYHHFVMDSIGGNPILVTYCTVCRTGRVFDPRVENKPEHFRLVGMDHFNAMIEDATTKSWWQQATGVAVAGPLRGKKLTEIISTQTTLAEWLKQNPHTLIMQEDPAFASQYDTSFNYEDGLSRKKLTGTDSLSWKLKSWVIGIETNGLSRAYDWNDIKRLRLIEDTLGYQNILIALANDQKSFFAFKNPESGLSWQISADTLYAGNQKYLVNGQSLGSEANLSLIPAHQEFWHSWKNFHPQTGMWKAPAQK